MVINIYTNRPWAYYKLFGVLQNYDCDMHIVSESTYREGNLKFTEDDILIADPKLLEVNDQILNVCRSVDIKKPYIIAEPVYTEAIIFEICQNTVLNRLVPYKNTDDREIIFYDENRKIELLSTFAITEKIRERVKSIEEMILNCSDLQDDSLVRLDFFREELILLIMRLSDILLSMRAKGFADGSFEPIEESKLPEEFNFDPYKKIDRDIFNLNERIDEVYNKEDETSLYYEYSIKNDIGTDKEAC